MAQVKGDALGSFIFWRPSNASDAKTGACRAVSAVP